ncbi:MAG: hypothetical protein M0R20_02920 [Candidatus Omnitrophica bacterium]|jgi:hypothetical protein|nr:hypothetical protein [Candidatus Omnitrophota bacterium]
MWLATTSIAAGCATLARFILPKKYKLDFLALMLWGAAAMILVDHIFGYEGGEFLEKTTDGMITNSTVLGLVMLVPVFIIWGVSLLIPRRTSHSARE